MYFYKKTKENGGFKQQNWVLTNGVSSRLVDIEFIKFTVSEIKGDKNLFKSCVR